MVSQSPPIIIEEKPEVESNKWRVLTEAGHNINDVLATRRNKKAIRKSVNKQIAPSLTTNKHVDLC